MTGAPSGTASTSIPPRSGDIHVSQKTNRHAPFTNGESSKVPVNSGKLYQETQPLFRSLHNNGLFPSHLRVRGQDLTLGSSEMDSLLYSTHQPVYDMQDLYPRLSGHVSRPHGPSGSRTSQDPLQNGLLVGDAQASQPGPSQHVDQPSQGQEDRGLETSACPRLASLLASTAATAGSRSTGGPAPQHHSNGSLGGRLPAGSHSNVTLNQTPRTDHERVMLASEMLNGGLSSQPLSEALVSQGNNFHSQGQALLEHSGGLLPLMSPHSQLTRPENSFVSTYDTQPSSAKIPSSQPGTLARGNRHVAQQPDAYQGSTGMRPAQLLPAHGNESDPQRGAGHFMQSQGGSHTLSGNRQANAFLAGRMDSQWGSGAMRGLALGGPIGPQATLTQAIAGAIPPEQRPGELVAQTSAELRGLGNSSGVLGLGLASSTAGASQQQVSGPNDAATQEILGVMNLSRAIECGSAPSPRGLQSPQESAELALQSERLRLLRAADTSDGGLQSRLSALSAVQQGGQAALRKAAGMPATHAGSSPTIARAAAESPARGPTPVPTAPSDRQWSGGGGSGHLAVGSPVPSTMPPSEPSRRTPHKPAETDLHKFLAALSQADRDKLAALTQADREKIRQTAAAPRAAQFTLPGAMGAPRPPQASTQSPRAAGSLARHVGAPFAPGMAHSPSPLPHIRPDSALSLGLDSSAGGAGPANTVPELRPVEIREPSGGPPGMILPGMLPGGEALPFQAAFDRLQQGPGTPAGTAASGEASPRQVSPQPTRFEQSPTLSRPAMDPEGRLFEEGYLPSLNPDAAEVAAFRASVDRHFSHQQQPTPFSWNSLPKVGRRPLNMLALYREVGLRGGFQKVEEQKGWKRIGDAVCGVGKNNSSLGSQIKTSFKKYLMSYSDRFYKPDKWAQTAALLVQRDNDRKQREKQEAKNQSSAAPKKPRPPPGQPKSKKPSAAAAKKAAQGAVQQQQPSQPQLMAMQPSGLWPLQQPVATGKKRSANQQAAVSREIAQQQALQRQQAEICAQISQHLVPAPGPYIVVPGHFDEAQAEQLRMALLGGVKQSVDWALNALGVASFQDQQGLLQQHPGILEGLQHVLRAAVGDPHHEALGEAVRVAAANPVDEDLWPPAKRLKTASHPGEPRGYWWEKEAGLVDPEAEDDRFTAGVAASQVLRNLAMLKANHQPLCSPSCIALWVECLNEREKEGSEGMNELARNVLDLLQQLASDLKLAEPDDHVEVLLKAISRTAEFGRAPLQLRKLANSVMIALLESAPRTPHLLPPLLAGKGEELLNMAMSLLLTPFDLVEEAVRAEAAGELGPTGLVDPVQPEVIEQASHVLHIEILHEACKLLKTLSRVSFGEEVTGLDLIVGRQRCLRCLIRILTESYPAELPTDVLSPGFKKHVVGLKSKMHALVVSIITRMDGQGCLQALLPYQGELALAAMSNLSHATDLCRILQKLAPPGRARRTDPILQTVETLLTQLSSGAHRS
eukprot:jgi/Botrbrau1/17443/Bobra.0054s0032.1